MWLALLLVVWVAVACYRLDLPGLQFDEVLFADALYPIQEEEFVERLMLMPYMGSLKAWLYGIWPPSGPWGVRLPMVLLSAATLGLIYGVLRRFVEQGWALAVVAVAALDPTYLLTSRYDWGPVVLQRLCFWGALLALTRRRFAISGLLCGVGLFDKLSFHWLIVAALLTAALLYRDRLKEFVRASPIWLAAFAAGSAPVWVYRVVGARTEEFRLESSWEALIGKLNIIGNGLTGRPLNGWIAHSYLELEVAAPAWMGWADWGAAGWLAGLYLVTFWFAPKSRLSLALLAFCGFVALQMVMVQGAGYMHHWALVSPVPTIAMGLALTGAVTVRERLLHQEPAPAPTTAPSRSRLRWIALTSILMVNVACLARQYTEIVDFGGRPTWSEAIYSLAQELETRAPEQVIVLDWGIEMQLRLLSQGRLPTRGVYDQPDRLHWLREPGERLFVAFLEPDLFEGARAAFESEASELGVTLGPLAAVKDRRGREIYGLWRVIIEP